MRSVFLEAYAKAILGFVWVFFSSLGLFFPLCAGAVGEAGSWGIPTTRLASHPLGALYMPQDGTGTESPL